MSFSRALFWLLHHYHQVTIATLIGFLVGSLNVTWPWKQPLATVINHHGETVVLQSVNVLPAQYLALTGLAPDTVIAIGCAFVGIVLVLMTEYVSENLGKN